MTCEHEFESVPISCPDGISGCLVAHCEVRCTKCFWSKKQIEEAEGHILPQHTNTISLSEVFDKLDEQLKAAQALTGWRCPGCGSCYAPHVDKCGQCPVTTTTTKESTS